MGVLSRDRAVSPTAVRRAVAVTSGVLILGIVGAAASFVPGWAADFAASRGVVMPDDAAAVVTVDGSGRQTAPVALVCPAQVAMPTGTEVGDDQFDATPVETTFQQVAAAVGGTVTSDDVARTVMASPANDGTIRAAGLGASVTTAGDLRGLAVGACLPAASDQWLLGGGTRPGESALLTVTNPGETSATVTLGVFGPAGPEPVGTGGSLVLAPGQSQQVRVDALASGLRGIAVGVHASGGRVAASMQVQALAGLVPMGVDIVDPAAVGRRLVVAGLRSDGQAVDDPHAPLLRLLAPNGEAGRVTLTVYGTDGQVFLRGAETVDLEPGVVTDVPLGGLDAGLYAVVVDADVPVVAAGQWSRQGVMPSGSIVDGTPVDVAWIPGQAPGEAGVAAQAALPLGVHVTMSMFAGGDDASSQAAADSPVTVRLVDQGGKTAVEQQVPLSAGALATVDISALVDVVLADSATAAPLLLTVTPGPTQQLTWTLTLTANDTTDKPETLTATLNPTWPIAPQGPVSVRQVPIR